MKIFKIRCLVFVYVALSLLACKKDISNLSNENQVAITSLDFPYACGETISNWQGKDEITISYCFLIDKDRPYAQIKCKIDQHAQEFLAKNRDKINNAHTVIFTYFWKSEYTNLEKLNQNPRNFDRYSITRDRIVTYEFSYGKFFMIRNGYNGQQYAKSRHRDWICKE